MSSESQVKRLRTDPQTVERRGASAGPSESAGVSESQPGQRWTFLTNHSHVLVLLHSHPELVLREVAVRVGITERAVQKITHDLEAGGFIVRERVGRRNRYRVQPGEPLRHPIEAHRKVGELLLLISSDSSDPSEGPSGRVTSHTHAIP